MVGSVIDHPSNFFLSKLYLVKVVEVVEVVVVGTVRGSLDDPGEVVGVLQRPQEVSAG